MVWRTTRASTRRRPSNTVIAGTRRRPYNRRPRRIYKKKFNVKTANKYRANLGLPKIDYKRYPLSSTANQYVTQTSALWSGEKLLTAVPETERTSQSIRIMPGKVKLLISQFTRDTLCKYRILVVKNFNDTDDRPDPDQVLKYVSNTDMRSYICGYVEKDDRAGEEYKVMKDIYFEHNTYAGNKATKKITFKIPTVNMLYNEVDSFGTYAPGHIWLFIMTDATASNANFTYAIDYTRTILDM